MSTDTESYADHPIITYSNRIQRHLYDLTKELCENNTIQLTEKRKLKLVIFNLPPNGKKALENITPKLEADVVVNTTEFDKMYSDVSDWIYINILQDAFRAIPLFRAKGKLEESTTRVSDNKGGLR
jgi:hypothetical protein